MDRLYRKSGEVVPYRGITSKRDLLPTEYALIDHLGLTREEYFEFLEQCHYASTERKEGYELVPDVVNGPVAPILINLAIGIALSAVSALLAPKPSQQQQKERKDLQTGDQEGRQRFTPYESFGSVQELAKLGSIIPLIYTNFGVRVSGKLLWSHLQSQGSSQQLRTIVLFGNGVTGVPAFKGFAIGDQLLENYGESRMRLYFSEGYENTKSDEFGYGRLRGSDEYSETEEGSWAIKLPTDPFQVINDRQVYKGNPGSWMPGLSGTRNVSVNAEFGVFSPLPNGHAYKLPYELVLVVDGSGKDTKDDARTKKEKLKRLYAINASTIAAGGNKAPSAGSRRVIVSKGDLITYRIDSDVFDEDGYEPWGLSDVNSSINSRRIETDEKLQIGEVFQLDTVKAVVIKRPRNIWRRGERHEYILKALDRGRVYLANNDAEIQQPSTVNALLRVQDGAVSNNRSCDITEIGLKSTVWKQITSFSNVNSQPSDKKIEKYEHNGDSIQLGSMSKYIERFSFFKLKARKAGGNDWTDLCSNRILCVKGNTPQAKYNALRVHHPNGQHEFKLIPIAGSEIMHRLGTTAYVLQHDAQLFRFSEGVYDLYINATTINLNVETLSNSEWLVGGAIGSKGEIIEINETQIGYVPRPIEPGEKECLFSDVNGEAKTFWRKLRSNRNKFIEVYWKGEKIARKKVKGPEPTSFTKGGYTYTRGASASSGSSGTVWKACRIKQQAKPKVALASVTTRTLVGQDSKSFSGKARVSEYKEGTTIVGYKIELAAGGGSYFDNELANINGISYKRRPVTLKVKTSASIYSDQKSLNPFDAVNDYYKYDEERSSHQDGPEHSVAYVNEIMQPDDVGADYKRLSIAGVALNSGYEFQSFSQLSAYFTDGIQTRRLRKGQVGNISSINTLPEIAYDLLTNTEYGIGELVGENFVDRDEMAAATDFCIANGFYWDGVISDQVAIRDFLYQNAAYCMMQFCCFSGEFFFKPSVPIFDDNRIFKGNANQDFDETKSKTIDIAGLWTDGNMKSFEVTFLPPEQRQTFRAEVSYRNEDINGFPTTKVVSVRLRSRQAQGGDKPGGSANDPAEAFDMTSFCVNEQHAVRFAKYALRVRSLVTHTVSFETTPEMAQGVMPGDFIRVCTEYSHFSRFDTGSIDANGNVQTAGGIKTDTPLDVYQWKVGTTGVTAGRITVDSENKVKSVKDWGTVFVRRNTSTQDRTYQVEGIEYGEEGYIKITASFAPSKDGKLEVLDWDDEDFLISE